MSIRKDYEIARENASKSDYMLERARELLSQAMDLPDGDDKRNWLQEEAARLIEEAEDLTNSAKSSSR